MPDPDIVIIGAGHNGLVAGIVMARAGFRVTVVEANPKRAGGALGSEEATLPGYVHDVGAAFFPFARASPAFADIGLGKRVTWHNMPLESCHPAPDGSVACIKRGASGAGEIFGTPKDGATWEDLVRWHGRIERSLLDLLLRPFPTLRPVFSLLPFDLFRLLRIMLSSGRGLAERMYQSDAARRVLPGLALHVDVGPDDLFGAALGYMLGLTATTGGYCIPEGGAQKVADALVALLEEHGGEVVLGQAVSRVRVEGKRAVGVVLRDGQEISAKRAVFANTGAPSLLLDLIARQHMPGRVVRAMERFPRGWGTFKVDWALSKPVPWALEPASRSAVVHAGDSLDDLSQFTNQVRSGQLPDNPYLVIGQQSLADPTRTPDDGHTLWAYSRVPPALEGGWSNHAEAFADRVDARIEGLAPGFRACIQARRVVSPRGLEDMDANLVGGDLGGGSNAWNRQLLFRPVFPYFRYRTPVRGLYLCSSYAHPGAGVHGMCGFNAAQIALRDLG